MISNITRASKPSLRIYKSKNESAKSTRRTWCCNCLQLLKGVMTADSAKSQNCGGKKSLCTVEVINCPRIAKRTSSNTKKWHVEINVSGQVVSFKGPKGEITLEC